MKQGPREADIKAALIDRLFRSRHVTDDAVLVSEMTIGSWTRRADLVLANGSLWAFEIKSEADSLARLPGQLEVFNRYFEKLVLVVAERFEDSVLRMAPANVGVWVVGDGVALKQRRAPRNSGLTPDAAIGLMTAGEIRRLLASSGLSKLAQLHRADLEQLVRQLSRRDLAQAARVAIKQRHRGRHERFVCARDTVGTLSALAAFVPTRSTSQSVSPPIEHPDVPKTVIPEGHPLRVEAPVGAILKRLKA